MSFEKIFDAVTNSGKPGTGDLVLFQVEDGRWTAARAPLLAQVLYAKTYEEIEQKALEYAADWSDRGIQVSVWSIIDANKDEYFKVL